MTWEGSSEPAGACGAAGGANALQIKAGEQGDTVRAFDEERYGVGEAVVAGADKMNAF